MAMRYGESKDTESADQYRSEVYVNCPFQRIHDSLTWRKNRIRQREYPMAVGKGGLCDFYGASRAVFVSRYSIYFLPFQRHT